MAVKRAVIAAIVGQFGHPQGTAGRVAGWVMAHRRSNRQRNRWVVWLLEVQPTDRVLEIGSGPGLAIAELARRVGDQGHVGGIDHAEVMLRQATRRYAAVIAAGRVSLHRASVEQLPPTLGGPFDAILAVNSLGFWPAPTQRLHELRRRLRPGGRIAIASQPRCPGATASTSRNAARELQALLRAAGYITIRTETVDLDPPVVCVLAVNPDPARERQPPYPEAGAATGYPDAGSNFRASALGRSSRRRQRDPMTTGSMSRSGSSRPERSGLRPRCRRCSDLPPPARRPPLQGSAAKRRSTRLADQARTNVRTTACLDPLAWARWCRNHHQEDAVIIRSFHATATADGADAYREHFTRSVLPGLQRIDGYQGAYLLRRDHDDHVELQVLTLWDSLEAISRFVGGNLDRAVVEPAAQAALASYDPTVTHHTVVVAAVGANAHIGQ